jgi:hypothetical protein
MNEYKAGDVVGVRATLVPGKQPTYEGLHAAIPNSHGGEILFKPALAEWSPWVPAERLAILDAVEEWDTMKRRVDEFAPHIYDFPYPSDDDWLEHECGYDTFIRILNALRAETDRLWGRLVALLDARTPVETPA